MNAICYTDRARWAAGPAVLSLILLGLICFCLPQNADADEPWLQRSKFTAEDGNGNDWFGYAVAVSDSTLVIGAPEADVTNANQGAVYVFTKGNQGWNDITQVAKLTAGDGAENDNFGAAVAVDGDTVVVGVADADGGQGAVYVFEKADTVGPI